MKVFPVVGVRVETAFLPRRELMGLLGGVLVSISEDAESESDVESARRCRASCSVSVLIADVFGTFLFAKLGEDVAVVDWRY